MRRAGPTGRGHVEKKETVAVDLCLHHRCIHMYSTGGTFPARLQMSCSHRLCSTRLSNDKAAAASASPSRPSGAGYWRAATSERCVRPRGRSERQFRMTTILLFRWCRPKILLAPHAEILPSVRSLPRGTHFQALQILEFLADNLQPGRQPHLFPVHGRDEAHGDAERRVAGA